MQRIKYFFIFLLFFPNIVFSYANICIDGANGFVGSSLLKDLQNFNPTVGCYDCNDEISNKQLDGDIRDPKYLKSMLKDSKLYFQFAALSSMESSYTLQDYILTNAISPYLASRINKSTTMVVISTIAVNDIEQNEYTNKWIERFKLYVTSIDINSITKARLARTLDEFILHNPIPQFKEYQYYGFSKLLMEKLLSFSSKDRQGKIFIFRSALIVGDGIHNRKGKAVVKSIMDTAFNYQSHYEVWNRTNYFTSIQKFKKMMLYVVNTEGTFGQFEILDAGWVTMKQHDFVKLLFKRLDYNVAGLKLVNNSKFHRNVSMRIDDRVKQFYPNEADIEMAINDMVVNYRSHIIKN